MKEKLIDYLTSLDERERNILIFFIFFMMFAVTSGIYFVMESSIDDKKAAIIEKEKTLKKIMNYKTKFKKAKSAENRIYSKLKNNQVNINSYITGIQESVGVDINTMRDGKPEKKGDVLIEKVEMSLRKVELSSLLTFLYAIENKSRYVYIENLSIKRRYNRNQNYDVKVTVATLKGEKE